MARPIDRLTLALAAALAAAPAAAQDAAPGALADPRAPKYADVERGVFVGFEVGAVALFALPEADPVLFPAAGDGGGLASGVTIGLQVGWDVTSRLALSLYGVGSNLEADASYGAFDLLAAGVDARWAFWARKDRNGWERLFLYVHGRGGFAQSRPEGLFGDRDVLLAAGVGVEYFAQLRHFSVGLQLDGVYALEAKSPGVALTPVVRYTF